MAFDNKQLSLVQSVNGFGLYRYDTEDAHAVVDTDGYFNNSDDSVLLRVGDIIDVVVWATAIRTGTVTTYGRHMVLADVAGVIDVTDVTVGVMTDTD
jgi:hypothetical protein